MIRCFLTTLFATLLCLAPVAAQYSDDEQTDDHELQDQQYYQRYLEQAEQPDAEPPSDDPQALREAYLSRADELIRDRHHRAAKSAHYRVQTDDPRVDPESVTALLEAFRAFFETFWSGSAELRPYDETSRVFLFYSFHKFNKLLGGDWRFREVRPAGHYRPAFDVITLHTDAGSPPGMADSLIHEAAHQLMEQRLYSHGHSPSLWVSEGLASYFGNMLLDSSDGFRPDRIGGKAVALFRGERPRAGQKARDQLQSLKRATRGATSDDPLALARLILLDDPAVFYGDAALLNYSTSWVLVHYLLHGDGGAHRESFARYLALDAGGQGGPAALHREIEMSAEELETSVTVYIRQLKAS